MKTDQLLREISTKLDRIIGLMAIRDVEDVDERIRLLRALGLDHQSIAAVTGMTANAVAVRIHRMRKGRGVGDE